MASDSAAQLKAALQGLRALKARVAELESGGGRVPIAIVGMACRFPGADDPEAWWKLLRAGVDAVGPVPADRWDAAAYVGDPEVAGTIASARGGFLDRPFDFDADFFRIAPKEARAMDPQQRLLLEVAWEALEDAGLARSSEGSATGVFLGLSLSEWGQRTLHHPDPAAIDAWAGTGTFRSVAAGRISYALGLRGPAVALDTACSSSLVAVHQAVASLHAGESTVALAGGANLLLSPDPSILFSRMGALSPRGRCAAFSDEADGYVRSEGVGIVVLKRLPDALRDGDRVLAVLRGSAVNQDGRSNGLTAPSGPAQEAVVRAALASAGMGPHEIGLIETHGTGTPLGDPIEVGALRAVFGGEGPPLWLMAGKSQQGHAEAAAGVAGLIRAVLVLQHGEVPPNLHAGTPSPRLPLAGSRLRLPTQVEALTGPRAVGVSSFGMSGTNAHVVLTAAPEADPATSAGPWVLPLAARDAERLLALAGAAAPYVEDLPGAAVAASRRADGPVRAAVVAHTPEQARAGLAALAIHAPGRGRVVLVLGDGLVLPEVLGSRPELRAVVEALAAEVPEAASPELAPLVAQWAAVQVLEGWGVVARTVVGVGRGALVAAAVAGVLPIAAALRAASLQGPARREALGPLSPPRRYLGSARAGRLIVAEAQDPEHWSTGHDDASAVLAALDEELRVGLGVEAALQPFAGVEALPRALAELWLGGVAVDWPRFQPGRPGAWPRTPWRHTPFMLPDPMEALREAAGADPLVARERWLPVELPQQARRFHVVGHPELAHALGSEALGPGVDLVDASFLLQPDPARLLEVARSAGSQRLHLLLQGRPDEAPVAVAACWGLARVLASERSAAWGGVLDVADASVARIADTLRRADGRDLSLADGLAEARLLPARLGHGAPRLRGTWWVTGGLGAVGLAVARRLVAWGAQALVLSGRRGGEAPELGVPVRVVASDVSQPNDVAALRRTIPDLAGVVHAAGVLDDAPADQVDAARLAVSWAPKVDGALALDAACGPDVTLIVLGSATWRVGLPGQAAYAAANAGARAVIAARRARGLPGLCLDFGPWALGMADAAVRSRLEAIGVHALDPQVALDLLGRALVADADARVLWQAEGARLGAVLGARAGFVGAVPLRTSAPAPVAVEPGGDAEQVVRQALAQVLGRSDPEALDPQRGYVDLGLDSMGAIQLARALERALGVPVPPTAAFDHGSIEGTLAWLRAQGQVAPEPPRAARPVEGAVAIVGMACRFPGADDPEALWQQLVQGHDAIGPVPADRWDADALFDPTPGTPGRAYVRTGAFLDAVEGFDADFFGISPREARVLDPQQRLLLEVGVEALDAAGIPLAQIRGSRTGVYVGIGPSDYARRLDAAGDPYVGTGNETSFAAGRLAWHLGAQGPAVGLNTACSSSLVAIHLAARALASGECDTALAGGVHLMLEPDTTVQLCQLRALSPRGRCHTFDASADGYARGEGCGLVVLRRLDDALRDGDPILAVLRATGINHDGPGAGLTVPSGDAQRKLLREVLGLAGLAPGDVGFLEAHGTGTRLGDPIELGAVREVYGQRPADRPLVVSSVKTHVGHTELAAGVAGVISAVQTLRHAAFAPHLHLHTLNPDLPVDFPVRFPTEGGAWTSAAPRRAAVSAFGLSGTNAHAILEEAPSHRGRAPLPPRAWQRERHWVERPADALSVLGLGWVAVPPGPAPEGAWVVRGGDGSLARVLPGGAVRTLLSLDALQAGDRLLDVREDHSVDGLIEAAATARRVVEVGASWWPVVGEGPWGAAVGGLFRGLLAEHAERAGSFVERAAGIREALVVEGLSAGPWVRVEDGGPSVPRLLPRQAVPQRVGGTWWVTGGLGAVGRALAAELVRRGATGLVLSGRSGGTAPDLGVPVTIEVGDVADAAHVAAVLARIPDLGGVVHAAGVLADGAVLRLDPEAARAVLRPKVEGARAIDAALGDRAVPLVLVGSAAAWLGWPGQSIYGAANAFLDGLAATRRARGLPAVAIAYGPWDGDGMASGAMRTRMEAAGMGALAPARAALALTAALGAGVSSVLVATLDVARWSEGRRLAGLFGAEAAHPVAPLVPAAAPASPDLRRAVRAAVAEVLGHADPDRLDASRGLFDLGLDSLLAVQLAHRLRAVLGVDVPDTLAFDAPSIDRIVEALSPRSVPAPEALSTVEDDPVCIVGMACRFPGAPDLEAYARLLREGEVAVGPVPADRWPLDAVPGATQGGFIEGAFDFEPAVFGLSPREATAMDPQQRLLLACAWEALEHASLAPDALRDVPVAVFVGIGGHDHTRLLDRAGLGPEAPFTGTGNDPAFAAGRIAWHLGTRGPAVALNTACSSSLVALHLARRAVLSGEARLALAGGVRLMLAPWETAQLAALRALSPTGRCHAFDVAADGYVRGEGVGLVVLQRLSDARREGRPVLAVLVGSAVNHDGASAGLTVPSGAAQEAVLRAALAEAGLRGADVDAVEAHGTGTPLGDPIELGALRAVYGERERALKLGAAKAQIGHTELAAGVAGVIKAVLALRDGVWHGHPLFHAWNPRADVAFPVEVPTSTEAWPGTGRRTVGVSAFGLSGTNAHVLLQEPPPERARPGAVGAWPVGLSSATEAGLLRAAERLAAWLEAHPDAPLADVATTLHAGRAQQPWRLGVAAADARTLAAALRAGAPVHRPRGEEPPRVAFLCTGQGAQQPGMTQGLYRRFPVYREVIDRCDRHLRTLRGEGLLPVLFPLGGDSPIGHTAWTQPALYAVEVALGALWASLGVEPDLLLGHSVGELAAATLAGLWSVEDGLTVVEARGRLMGALPAGGAMAALRAPVAQVEPWLGEGVELAAVNAPDETVVSGDEGAVHALVARAEAEGVAARRLEVSHAFHSARMAPMLAAFEAVVASVPRTLPTRAVVSGFTGRSERERLLEPAFWSQQVRAPVRFAEAVRTAVDEGAGLLVEVGPHPVLVGLAARTVGAGPLLVGSLRRGQDDVLAFAEAVARVGTRLSVRLEGWGEPGALRALPGIVWQATPHRIDVAPVVLPPPAAPAARASAHADVRALVSEEVGALLGYAPSGLDPRAGFFDLGLDSVTALALTERLSARLGRDVPPQAAFDHPTIARLVAFLGGDPAPVAPTPPVVRLDAAQDDPIVVVGLACRFPGAPDPEAFWRLLDAGRSAVGEAPEDRWPGFRALVDPEPGKPGRTVTSRGAFLDDLAGFDPLRFGIAPREAEAMDPQQRLMLEVCWEALEDASLAPASLDGEAVGVFVGMGASEYDLRFAHPTGGVHDAYAGTGNDTSFAAGRIAWLLGAVGPAVTLNTACSAGLVAVHEAARALQEGSCTLALAGAVNLMVVPESHLRLSAIRALSPSGLCRAFDADADGYVRGEGAGAVLLTRRSVAIARGLPIAAVLRGSAVGHGGRSSGLTVPNGPAQTAVIRRAWAAAGITPDALGYVEAHGTGTRLGDPIEARALADALGPRTRPLPVGSVKTNIGHLELAAGIAGFVKVVLMLRHGRIPAHVHLRTRNPDIPASLPLDFPLRSTPWEGPRVAGVSAFGLSGTNAHVVLEGVAPAASSVPSGAFVVVPVAAHVPDARDRLAAALADTLSGARLEDVALTSALGRSSGRWRVAVAGDAPGAVADALRGGRSGRFEGEAPMVAPGVGLVFAGAGAGGSVGAMLDAVPALAGSLREVDAVVRLRWGRSAVEALRRGEGETPGPALFAFQVALARWWIGLTGAPVGVLGHGAGEIAAAVIAGAWSVDDAARFAVARAAAVAGLPPGRLLAVRAGEAEVLRRLAGRTDVGIAAVNGPEEVVVAGLVSGIEALLPALADLTVLPVSGERPVHTPPARAIVESLMAEAQGLGASALPFVGGSGSPARPDGVAMALAVAEPVRFADGLGALTRLGAGVLVEVGVHPLLVGSMRRAVDPRAVLLLAPHRTDRGWPGVAEALAAAWVRGVEVDWTQVPFGADARRIRLPTTPSIRRRCWVDVPAS